MESMLLKYIKPSLNRADVSEMPTNKGVVSRHGQPLDKQKMSTVCETFPQSLVVDEPSTRDDCGSQLTETSTECPECGKKFYRENQFEEHVNGIHKKIKPYVCQEPECHFRNAYQTNLIVHSRRSHGDGQQKLTCDWPYCNFTTTYTNSLRQHLREHTNERPYQCQHWGCGLTFLTKYSLKSHIRPHSESLAVVEPSTSVQFDSQSKTHNEMKGNYNRDSTLSHLKSFDCPECGKKLKRKETLQNHIKLVHKNIRPYVCPQPGCQFGSAF